MRTQRPNIRRFLATGWLVGSACLLNAYALPVVSAGDDQTRIPLSTAAGGNIYLMGAVTDDGQPSDSVVWSSLPAVAGVSFGDRLSAVTRATLPDTGTWFLELRAYYGETSYGDTVRITVRPNLPFVVTMPREMEQVEIGKPLVIRWQMDPSKRCTIELSVDQGLTFEWLNPSAAVKDSLVWNVPDSLVDGTVAILKIHEYQVFDPEATRTFVLVNHTPDPYQSVHPQQRRNDVEMGGFVRRDRDGVVRFGSAVSGDISVFDARGRLVLQSPVRNGIASGSVATRGVLTFRCSDEGKLNWCGLVAANE